MKADSELLLLKELVVDVVEPGHVARSGAVACELDRHICFNTEILQTFASVNWQSVVYDALVVAAAVEFCDRSRARGTVNWGRKFRVFVPVHDPARWADQSVSRTLADALNFLTGDLWQFSFRARRSAAKPPAQSLIELPREAEAVIAYSEGMDSRAAYGLEFLRLRHRLVRVRVGSGRQNDLDSKGGLDVPFAALPYSVKLDKDNAENSNRSRGFKFSVVAAVAAYLLGAPSVILPESGQGALGAALLPVGQGYADYRNHPLFTRRMEKFVLALLGHQIRYRFPRLWSTKGQTLRAFVEQCGGNAKWSETRSCWQGARQTSVMRKHRQCGVCAACILRRLSVHAAGLTEQDETYVWENLRAGEFREGAAADFGLATAAMREYAIAGVLHFEHLALLKVSGEYELLKRQAAGSIARALGESYDVVASGMDQLLKQHASEWVAFKGDLGSGSFVRKWIGSA
ncbi:7-cyano-7-deazaguanine synthase [Cupriavidus sp. H18C2]|uniref:7-cyano-7-deazaguanine synthase n=1 Tax=Cupriavidus sp. H18C2 TaxID=3241602 RepID=UPI003BF828A6